MKARQRSTFGGGDVAGWVKYVSQAEKAARIRHSDAFLHPERAIADMRALALAAPPASRALEHWVISFAPDEAVTLEGAAAIVDDLYRELGVSHALAIDVAHGDALCRHVHCLVLRVDPATLDLIPRTDPRAVARTLEERYSPREQAHVARAGAPRAPRPLSGAARDAETYNGRISLTRFLRNELAGVATWGEHDRRLTQLGVERIETDAHGRRGFVYRDARSRITVRGSAVLDPQTREHLGERPAFTPDPTATRIPGYTERPLADMLAPGITLDMLDRWEREVRPGRSRLGVFALKRRSFPGEEGSSLLGADGSERGGRARHPSGSRRHREARPPRPNTAREISMSGFDPGNRLNDPSLTLAPNRIGFSRDRTQTGLDGDRDIAIIKNVCAQYKSLREAEREASPTIFNVIRDYDARQTARAAVTDHLTAALADNELTEQQAMIAHFEASRELAAHQERTQIQLALARTLHPVPKIPTLDKFVGEHANLSDPERVRALELLDAANNPNSKLPRFPEPRALASFAYDEALGSMLGTTTSIDPNTNNLVFRQEHDNHTRCFFDGDGFQLDARPNSEDIDFALHLAAQRYNGAIDISGSKEFVAAALERAVELGYHVSTPELQQEYDRLVAERDARLAPDRVGLTTPVDLSFGARAEVVLREFEKGLHTEEQSLTPAERELALVRELVLESNFADFEREHGAWVLDSDGSNLANGETAEGPLLTVIPTELNGNMAVVDGGHVANGGSHDQDKLLYVTPVELDEERGTPRFLEPMTLVGNGTNALAFERGQEPLALDQALEAGRSL
jgi:hypothetical protein